MISDTRRLRLLMKDCASGFYQQMYFLGKDVCHPQGNQLETFGFKKSPSQGLKGTSCYTLTEEHQTIELYGSCAALYNEEANMVFLRKRCRFFEWLPEYKLIAGRWSAKDVTEKDIKAVYASITPLLEWWIRYEEWILEQFGSAYREQCYQEWKKVKSRTPWLAPEEAIEWVKEFLTNGADHVRPKHFTPYAAT